MNLKRIPVFKIHTEIYTQMKCYAVWNLLQNNPGVGISGEGIQRRQE